jgi:hypothetical protein
MIVNWACGSPIFMDIWLGFFEKRCLGVNPSKRFIESLRRIATESAILGESWTHLPILLRDSKNLREGLAWNAWKLQMIIQNWGDFIKILKPEAVHIQA